MIFFECSLEKTEIRVSQGFPECSLEKGEVRVSYGFSECSLEKTAQNPYFGTLNSELRLSVLFVSVLWPSDA